MVTDAQYMELQNRVKELEKKIDFLSMQMSRMMFKGEVSPIASSTNEILSKKDITKYKFRGQLYCKRRIAYMCVITYIKEHDIKEYKDVIEIFPDYLQGSLGVIKPIEMAEKYANAHRRYYFADDDIIYLSGRQYVVCSQWEKKNIHRILSVAQKLGYEIMPIIIE